MWPRMFPFKTVTVFCDARGATFIFCWKTKLYLEMWLTARMSPHCVYWELLKLGSFWLSRKCRTDHIVGDVWRGQLLGRHWLFWKPDFTQTKPLMIKKHFFLNHQYNSCYAKCWLLRDQHVTYFTTIREHNTHQTRVSMKIKIVLSPAALIYSFKTSHTRGKNKQSNLLPEILQRRHLWSE